jgi:uncharacterized protein with HEPN domain
MRPEAAALLWDARGAAERIARFTTGRELDDYLADDLLRAAVERQFEIIGEALGRLRATDPDMAANIPELARIVAFRNVLIHGYATVDDRLVWDVVQVKLPVLRAALHALLPDDT